MKKPESSKERNLIKGALRRVFSRSEVRLEALKKNRIEHSDPTRPRVTKWAWCSECGLIEAAYQMQVDHINPVIDLHQSLDDMTWDQVVGRLWCDLSNLAVICKPCHKLKSKIENQERRRIKKGRK